MNIGLGDRRKTILLVDADPHARAVMRKALEAARFSVGEAASNREGERTLQRIRPDAVLADLLGAPSDAGITIFEWIRVNDGTIPCYIVSTASDALAGSVGFHELGVTGVFLKPVDMAVVVQTLRTRLGVASAGDGHA
jgi:two-component system OmpR family response regulator